MAAPLTFGPHRGRPYASEYGVTRAVGRRGYRWMCTEACHYHGHRRNLAGWVLHVLDIVAAIGGPR